jgi:hypothetical protein
MLMTLSGACMSVMLFVACESLDGDTFSMRLVNDTANRLVFYPCKHRDCLEFTGDRVVEPGRSFEITMVAKKGFLSRYLLLDADGEVRGCISLEFAESQPGIKVYASQAEVCPADHALPPSIRR